MFTLVKAWVFFSFFWCEEIIATDCYAMKVLETFEAKKSQKKLIAALIFQLMLLAVAVRHHFALWQALNQATLRSIRCSHSEKSAELVFSPFAPGWFNCRAPADRCLPTRPSPSVKSPQQTFYTTPLPSHLSFLLQAGSSLSFIFLGRHFVTSLPSSLTGSGNICILRKQGWGNPSARM